uniref:Lipoprotein n=1 Tax=Steinernema glaseri TaxID=37863 RepID=A0A1I7YZS0_9BILA
MFSSKCTAFGLLALAFFISWSIACHPQDIVPPKTTKAADQQSDSGAENGALAPGPEDDATNPNGPKQGGDGAMSSSTDSPAAAPTTCETTENFDPKSKVTVTLTAPTVTTGTCTNAYGLKKDAAKSGPLVITPLQLENDKVSCKGPDVITIKPENFDDPNTAAGGEKVTTDAMFASADCKNEKGICKQLDAFVLRYDSDAPTYFKTIEFEFSDNTKHTFSFASPDKCCEQMMLWFGMNKQDLCKNKIKATGGALIPKAVNADVAAYFLVRKDVNGIPTISHLDQKEYEALKAGAALPSPTVTCDTDGQCPA